MGGTAIQPTGCYRKVAVLSLTTGSPKGSSDGGVGGRALERRAGTAVPDHLQRRAVPPRGGSARRHENAKGGTA